MATRALEMPPPAPIDDVLSRSTSDAPLEQLLELDDEGPPSAPRLREEMGSADEEAGQEQEFLEREAPIQTPPPESGRQHVAASVAASLDDDDDISITVTEESVPPSGELIDDGIPSITDYAPSSANVTAIDETDEESDEAPLAFVPEPEIELNVPPAPTRAPTPAPPRFAPPAFTAPASAPPAPSGPVPVRLMAQPGAGGAAPVEIWASIHAPALVRDKVASFTGQNASFAPKTFGELVEASLGLGES